jgi:hypothetical protein
MRLIATTPATPNPTVTTNTITHPIEDPTPSDIYIGKDNDIGRPSAVNNNNTQLHRKSSIRFGGKYIIGSFINELHRYIPTDIVEANNNYGAVTVMADFENILFVAQEHKCHIRYLNRTMANLGTGQEIVLDASAFLSNPDYFMYNYGCTNPESYARNENSCFFYDGINGSLIVQYSPQNGVINISGNDIKYSANRGQDTYFKKLKAEIDKIPLAVRSQIAFIFGGYHTLEFNELFITNNKIHLEVGTPFGILNKTILSRNSNSGEDDFKFKNYSDIQLKEKVDLYESTIAYDARRNFWFGERSHHGEAYIVSGSNAIAFKNGVCYLLDKSPFANEYNTFFGTKYNSSLTVIANDNPSDVKDYLAFSIESNSFWKNILNTIPYSPTVGRAQEIITHPPLIQNKNGVFYVAIQKDRLTPNIQFPLYEGKDMIGNVMLLEFENESAERVELFCINVYSGYVGRTNF